MRNARTFVLVISILCIFISAQASAQATSGDLVGTVTDPSGAVIVKATVEVKNVETGVVTLLTTTSSGQYHAANLLPGKYDINVTAPGIRRRSSELDAIRPSFFPPISTSPSLVT